MATVPKKTVSYFDLVKEAKVLAAQAAKLSKRLRLYQKENTNARGKFNGHPPREPNDGGP